MFDSGEDFGKDAKCVDANGGTLLPGLIDTHCHPFEFGWLKRNVDLRGTSNITGLRLRLSAKVQRAGPGEWVTGMGWDQEAFAERRMPNRQDIDDVSGEHPVMLTRICGHIALLNSAAIRSLGLEGRRGPEFQVGPDGSLTGIVMEAALTEASSKLPRTPELSSADLLAFEFEAARVGLTAAHCILSPEGFKEEAEAVLSLHRAGSLSLGYSLFIPPEALPWVEERGIRKAPGEGKVRIAGVKLYSDGSLGARTAALREPYADDPGNSGLLRYTDGELADLVQRADASGYRVAVHAIGDRAVEQAIAAISRVSGKDNHRGHRIEHASLLPPDLLAKMARFRIRATVQPLFITSDSWAESRLGEERVRHLYPLRSMLAEGIVASGSSDAPVESVSPILAMWAAMARGGFAEEESLSLEEAVRLYTSNARSNGLEEPWEVSEGAPADLTLLDSGINGMHPALLRKVRVALTITGGSVAYTSGVGPD